MRIDKFVSAISKYQPLTRLTWGIFIGRPGANNERLNLMVRECSLPGRSLKGNDFAPYGPGRHIAARHEYTEDFTMSFLVGKDGYESDYFAEWMDKIVDPKTHNPNYYENYVVDVGIQQYDKSGLLRYAWKFYEVYPVGIGLTELDNAGDGDIHIKSDILFKYRYYNSSGVTPTLPKIVDTQPSIMGGSKELPKPPPPQDLKAPRSIPPRPSKPRTNSSLSKEVLEAQQYEWDKQYGTPNNGARYFSR